MEKRDGCLGILLRVLRINNVLLRQSREFGTSRADVPMKEFENLEINVPMGQYANGSIEYRHVKTKI